MEMLIIGLVAGLIFFICLAAIFYIGYRVGSKMKPAAEQKLTKEQQEELKRRREGLQNIMNYDLKQAMGGKQ